MSATKEDKVSLDLLPHTTNTCASSTPKQVHNPKKVKKSSHHLSCNSTIKTHSKPTETSMKANYQITFSFTEMVLEIP